MSLLFLNKYSNILFFLVSVGSKSQACNQFSRALRLRSGQSVYFYPDDADTKLVPAPV